VVGDEPVLPGVLAALEVLSLRPSLVEDRIVHLPGHVILGHPTDVDRHPVTSCTRIAAAPTSARRRAPSPPLGHAPRSPPRTRSCPEGPRPARPHHLSRILSNCSHAHI